MARCSKKVNNKQCEKRAIKVYQTRKGGCGRCEAHIEDPPKNIIGQGEPCEFCDRGFIQQWSHVDGGAAIGAKAKGIVLN